MIKTEVKQSHEQKISARFNLGHTYYLDLSAQLLDFANRNYVFSLWLQRLINDKWGMAPPPSVANQFAIINTLVPLMDVVKAQRRATWILDQFTHYENHPAAELLKTWANSKTALDPKAVIIGVVGVAIPGITLGLIKKQVNLPCIFNEKILFKTKLDFAKAAIDVGTGLIQSALNMVEKDIHKIDPDISDWFFGNRNIAYYYASDQQLRDTFLYIKERGAPVYAAREGEQIIALSFTPALNSEFYRGVWGFRELVATK